MHNVIVADKIGKQFHRYHPERPMTFVETFARGLHRFRATDRFWALRDVSFTITAGRMVGIIGRNGAGKSTLLRLLGGVGRPDEGRVEANGRIGALLDLGAGFHDELTGRENVFISGVISGLTRREVAARFDEIVAFAELEASIDNPLRTYSTGMQMRLAFAVAVHIDPDILLIDEVLAVGDIAFQRKCLDRIAQFKARGCTVVLVSHDPTLVRELCDEAIWLRDGRIVTQGAAEVVVGQYVAEMKTETSRRTPTVHAPLLATSGAELRVNENRFGSLEMEITAVHLVNENGRPAETIESGAPLTIKIEYNAPQPVLSPIFGVTISREDGFVCYDTHTAAADLGLSQVQGRGNIHLQLDRLDLVGDTYYLDVGVYEKEWAYAYDYHWHVYPLVVHSAGGEKGVLRPPHRWSARR